MRAMIREIREVQFDIDPWAYPEGVDSWEAALECDRRRAGELDLGWNITVEGELLGDPKTEPWPEGDSR